ncbi:MAG: alkaline phosphatase family protein [Bacillota bacterium]|nr:alkaline phosphatase family protein [Bacillota bacterium]
MLNKYGLLFFSVLLFLSGCSQAQKKETAPALKKTIQQTVVKVKMPKIDHILIVVEENRSKQAITHNHSAPYINSLMQNGANFTNYYAIEHPSQPNYLDIFSGSNQGVTNDWVPKTTFSTNNLANELMKKRYTFTGYSEGLPKVGFNGASTGSGGYARKHNPWVNFNNIPKKWNQPLSSLPSDFSQLPTISFVIPNLQHDMHDGTIKEGDNWLKKHIDSYVQWAKTHNSLLIVTWDEDDRSQNNKIPTFLVGPMVKTGQYIENVNHFNLLRTLEDLYGLSHIDKSKSVNPITDVWK